MFAIISKQTNTTATIIGRRVRSLPPFTFIQHMLAAVQPTTEPLRGVKRALSGNPTSVPGNLPAFRGRPVEPTEPVKAPKLSVGNRPNEGSNVTIPYARICPLEHLSSDSGRLSPGDVCFVVKHPPGFLNKCPSNGVNTMSDVVGLDGVNRLLHGATNVNGWVQGLNVMVLDKDKNVFHELMKDSATGGEKADATKFYGISVLDEIRLDGIIMSNNEEYSSTPNGVRDSAVFNVAVQGPALCNNGYLMYDPNPNVNSRIDGKTEGRVVGGTPLRTVEAYPRGTPEGGYHLQVNQPPGRVGTTSWMKGNYDFVATFTGTFSAYPAQMFERTARTLDTLYIGVRCYEITNNEVKKKIKKPNMMFYDNSEMANKRCFFFQLMPFSSKKAWLCQYAFDKIEKFKNSDEYKALGSKEDKEKALKSLRNTINAKLADQSSAAKKSRFDEYAFDAVRTEDLQNMVGAWKVGRVIDSKAMRHAAYEGGPTDTGFALMVDVQVAWNNALHFKHPKNFFKKYSDSDDIAYYSDLIMYSAFGRENNPDETEKHKEARKEIIKIKDNLRLCAYYAQNPTMSTTIGTVFGMAFTKNNLSSTTSTTGASMDTFQVALPASPLPAEPPVPTSAPPPLPLPAEPPVPISAPPPLPPPAEPPVPTKQKMKPKPTSAPPPPVSIKPPPAAAFESTQAQARKIPKTATETPVSQTPSVDLMEATAPLPSTAGMNLKSASSSSSRRTSKAKSSTESIVDNVFDEVYKYRTGSSSSSRTEQQHSAGGGGSKRGPTTFTRPE